MATVTVVVVLGAFSAVVAWLLAGSGDRSLEEQRGFPAEWSSPATPYDSATVVRWIELRRDGTAHLVDVTVGDVVGSPDERYCMVPRGEEYTGEARWISVSAGRIRVDTPRGSFFLVPDYGLFGTFTWQSAAQPLCEEPSIAWSGVP